MPATRQTRPGRPPTRPGQSGRIRRQSRSIGELPRRRRGRLTVPVRITIALAILVVGLLGWATIARSVAPRANTPRAAFDAIIVLGTPADSDGNPTPELLDRVSEGVREYERGVAPRLIVTGAAAHNQFIEAQVMARVAHAQGVPESRILVETHALDTIQNVCYADRILNCAWLALRRGRLQCFAPAAHSHDPCAFGSTLRLNPAMARTRRS